MAKQFSFVNFITTFYLFYIITVSRISCSGGDGTFRVVGGRDAQPNEFPYVLRMELHKTGQDWGETSQSHWCTVSALSSTVSLTAAHCCVLIDTPIKEAGSTADHKVVIRYSASNRPSKDDRFFEVFSYKVLPSTRHIYHPLMYDDLALIATQPILLSKYGKLSALDYRTLYGKRITILGYGKTKHGRIFNDTLTLNKPLQVVDAILSRCDTDGPMRDSVVYPSFCVVTACGTTSTACPGDSGGPILHSSGIIGIISRGTHYCKENEDLTNPVAYGIPVSSYIDWIGYTTANMAKNSNNNV